MLLSRTIFFYLSLVMLVISILLITEYHYFKTQSCYLEQLKDEYNQNILILKKIITLNDSISSNLSAKKCNQNIDIDALSEANITQNNDVLETEDPTGISFLTVNRQANYLKKSAIDFARYHNLEWAIKKLYEADSWVAKTMQDKDIVRRKNNNQKEGMSLRGLLKEPAKDVTQDLEKKSSNIKRDPIFIWPLDRSQFWLSSIFGPRKKPDGSWGFHSGIDMAAVKGTPVKAAGAGIVKQAESVPGYGNTIVIVHDKKFKTRYAHLDKIGVRVGQKVSKAEYIGNVGETGFVRKSKKGTDASHLHFEVEVFGKRVNPFYFLA